jgi:hypothetical protein
MKTLRAEVVAVVLGLWACTGAHGALYGPYFPSDGSFGNNTYTLVDSTPGALTGLVSPLSTYTLYLNFDNTALSGTIGGSLTLNGIATPAQDLSGLQNLSATSGSINGYSYNYSLTFSSGELIGQNPNAQWTLTLFDTGKNSAENLNSWSLGITAVPEPVNVALGIFAGVFVVGGLCRTQRVRNRLHRCWVGINHWLDAV